MSDRQKVECAGCGWTGKRKVGNVVTCPKCGAIAAFQMPTDRPGGDNT